MVTARPPRRAEGAFEPRDERNPSEEEERLVGNGGAVTNRSSPGPGACRRPYFLYKVPVTKARFEK